MTTFQAVVYSIVQGFSEFLPISASAHRRLLAYFVGWPEPSGDFLGALYLGSFLSVLLYFIHDWASLGSSFLQVVVYRKKPMTLDERMPLFLVLASLPVAGAWYYLAQPMADVDWSPLLIAAILAGVALPLWYLETWSRKNKAIYDWNLFDSIFVGIFQILLLVPGAGRTSGALIGSMLRNYSREGAAKFAFLASTPLLAASTALHLRESVSNGLSAEVTWLTFLVTVIVTCLCGLLAIGGFMKHIQRKGFGQYALYRIVLALAVVGVWWFRDRQA